MNVINFVMNNWDIITLVIAAIAAVIYAVFRGNKSVVMKMLYSLVTEAEKNFGSGTGPLKLASVIAEVYPKLPAVIKLFITEETIEKWIEEALEAAKKKWESNANIQAYITPAELPAAEANAIGFEIPAEVASET